MISKQIITLSNYLSLTGHDPTITMTLPHWDKPAQQNQQLVRRTIIQILSVLIKCKTRVINSFQLVSFYQYRHILMQLVRPKNFNWLENHLGRSNRNNS